MKSYIKVTGLIAVLFSVFLLTSCGQEPQKIDDGGIEIPKNETSKTVDMMDDTSYTPDTEVIGNIVAGTYADYSEDKLMNLEGDTVLFFHATWCPSCKGADKNLSADTIPDNLTILKVDYDASTDLKQKYEVTSQHTFVQVDKDGNMVQKWFGSRDIEDIVEKL